LKSDITMRVLILNVFLQNAAAIKERVLNYNSGIESITICSSREEAIQQTEQYGIHMIILDLEAEGASQFLLSVNKHPHRIISTSANYSRDYFTARLLEANSLTINEHKKSRNAFSKLIHQLFF
jgi:DNA-binding NarL/FixJ family response regulator